MKSTKNPMTDLDGKSPAYRILFFVISLLILTAGCNKEEMPDINAYLASLPPISDEMPTEKTAQLDSTVTETELEYIYNVEYYSAAAGYNEQMVLNPTTDCIFPGALIKGESVLDGSYVQIAAPRNPITLSTSLTGAGNVAITIDDPKLSTIRTAINNLMSQEYDVPPANLSFTIEQAYSEEQLQLSLRASYESGMFDIAGGFDFENKQIKTRLVAKFIQSYYTLDMDMPSTPDELFSGDLNHALVGTYMPMYVSSVTYGRMALFTIESTLEETEVKAFLETSYGNLDASASAEFESLISSSTMKVYILGGSGGDASGTIDGFEAFKDYIKAGGNFSKESPGAPISYKLRYIADNTIGKIVLSACYPIRTAVPRTDNLRYDVDVYYYSIKSFVDDWGTDAEWRGYIYSYVEGDSLSTVHNHFFAINMPQNGESPFAANSTTLHRKSGLSQSDTISLYVNIWEDDDFSFLPANHHFNIGTITLESGVFSGTYDTGNELKQYALGHGTNYYVTPRFKFSYTSYRIGDD